MTAKENARYGAKESILLYINDSSRLMGITDAWDVVYDVIDKETEDT